MNGIRKVEVLPSADRRLKLSRETRVILMQIRFTYGSKLVNPELTLPSLWSNAVETAPFPELIKVISDFDNSKFYAFSQTVSRHSVKQQRSK